MKATRTVFALIVGSLLASTPAWAQTPPENTDAASRMTADINAPTTEAAATTSGNDPYLETAAISAGVGLGSRFIARATPGKGLVPRTIRGGSRVAAIASAVVLIYSLANIDWSGTDPKGSFDTLGSKMKYDVTNFKDSAPDYIRNGTAAGLAGYDATAAYLSEVSKAFHDSYEDITDHFGDNSERIDPPITEGEPSGSATEGETGPQAVDRQ